MRDNDLKFLFLFVVYGNFTVCADWWNLLCIVRTVQRLNGYLVVQILARHKHIVLINQSCVISIPYYIVVSIEKIYNYIDTHRVLSCELLGSHQSKLQIKEWITEWAYILLQECRLRIIGHYICDENFDRSTWSRTYFVDALTSLPCHIQNLKVLICKTATARIRTDTHTSKTR